jgi:hypothetical protein
MSAVLISHMRAGSHLAAAILDLAPFVAHDEQTGEMIPVRKLISVIKMTGGGVWTYYPYDKRLEYYLKFESTASLFLLVRDPRDIIVSTAHFCEKYPDTFLNYKVDGKLFSEMSVKERIDHLIDDILEESLFNFERWRKTGMFTVLRYRDLVYHPKSLEYKTWLRRGVTGSYKDEMTPEQIKRSTDKYRELIEAW